MRRCWQSVRPPPLAADESLSRNLVCLEEPRFHMRVAIVVILARPAVLETLSEGIQVPRQYCAYDSNNEIRGSCGDLAPAYEQPPA